ncbi:4-hydroxy-tetrahydrodipicolinate synthase [Rhizobium sp. BK181]|uniref:4-hydroxy-tetrahydrodipicolinate synthase n=1 Tax=Rhizobium sp. BK181 TaxID=2587072 RepID=UPI00161023E2|nr:4-hydroxy-tetrahydrodipicolinate synthase [Rhizobium sp. BK181]MBB3318490.1 4-hydroxy-tetrahydrodipicolinate synthase [Rhizobium sp. BK181]
MPADRTLRLGPTTTALVTPFREGVVDLSALEQLVEWQIQSGVDGLAVCTATGEGSTLTRSERAAAILTCVRVAAGRVPVIAATGTNATASTIALTRDAEELGAAAALVTLPYYSKPGQKGIASHFAQLAFATSLPLIVENNPLRTAIDMTSTTLNALADIPSVVGFVLADGSVAARTLPPEWRQRFLLLSDCDATALSFLSTGGSGIISAGANLCPRLYASLQQAARGGNLPAARQLEGRLAPLTAALGAEGDPAAIKYALQTLRLIDPEVRLPLLGVEANEKQSISQALLRASGAHDSSLSI